MRLVLTLSMFNGFGFDRCILLRLSTCQTTSWWAFVSTCWFRWAAPNPVGWLLRGHSLAWQLHQRHPRHKESYNLLWFFFWLLEAALVKSVSREVSSHILGDISIFYPCSSYFCCWNPHQNAGWVYPFGRWPSLFWPMPSSISCSWISCHVTGPLGIHGLWIFTGRIKTSSCQLSFHRIWDESPSISINSGWTSSQKKVSSSDRFWTSKTTMSWMKIQLYRLHGVFTVSPGGAPGDLTQWIIHRGWGKLHFPSVILFPAPRSPRQCCHDGMQTRRLGGAKRWDFLVAEELFGGLMLNEYIILYNSFLMGIFM